MVRKLLDSHSNDLERSQQENLFHTRCKVFDKICSLVVDSESYSNGCSARVVLKLNLSIIPHPKLYKLQWINEDGGLIMSSQVNIPITKGSYQETILCHSIPMDARHLLLGYPWLSVHKAIHDRKSNKINFRHVGKKITLCPLTPTKSK